MQLPFVAFGASRGQRIELSLRLLDGEVLLARYPAEGTFELIVPDESFGADWTSDISYTLSWAAADWASGPANRSASTAST